jgi:pimeloyl-ACP methyl ester carboxylesterase
MTFSLILIEILIIKIMKTLQFVRCIHFLFIQLLFLFTTSGFSQDNKNIEYIPLSFNIDGSNLSGQFFKADVTQPAATVVMLQGFPGREGEYKGIGSFLKKEGINAYVFNYRGSWKSEGFFTIPNAIEDAVEAVKFLQEPEIFEKYNIDTARIILLGYSWGAGSMFLSAVSCPSVKKLISIETTNLKIISDRIESDTSYRRENLNNLERAVKSQVIRGETTAVEAQDWMRNHADELDLVRTVDRLADKEILFIGGWNDVAVPIELHMLPLYRSFQKRNAAGSKLVLFDSDHTLNSVLPELHKCILNWIKN